MTRSIPHILVLMTLLMLASACFGPRDRDEVVGTYVAEYAFATEWLTLNPDGSCSQEIEFTANQNFLIGRGRWSYVTGSATGRVALDDLYIVSDRYGNLLPQIERGDVSYTVERYFFSRQLRLGRDGRALKADVFEKIG
jgi:hypothetical protein